MPAGVPFLHPGQEFILMNAFTVGKINNTDTAPVLTGLSPLWADV